MVEALDLRAVFAQADVRDPDAIEAAPGQGSPNRGISPSWLPKLASSPPRPATDMIREMWRETNLHGVWYESW